jgi:hypothetical protein
MKTKKNDHQADAASTRTVLDAVNALELALAWHGHAWTRDQLIVYQRAVRIMISREAGGLKPATCLIHANGQAAAEVAGALHMMAHILAAEHRHEWMPKEQALYEKAIAILKRTTGAAT